MVSLFGFAALSLVSLLFVRLDRRLWGTAVTPGVMLVAGYAAIAGVYAIARLFYDFVEVRWGTYAVMTVFALVCMAGSFLSTATLRWRPAEIQSPLRGSPEGSRAMMLIAIMAFLPLAVVTSLGNGGLWSTDARDAMSGGLVGHLHVMLAFATVWYAIAGRDKVLARAPILLVALLALSLYPVKGWTLIPLSAVVFALLHNSGERAAGWKYLPLLGAAGTAVFFVVYLSRADLGTADFELVAVVLSEVFQHFIFYLTAGLFGLDAVVAGLELHGGFAVLFAPLHNILAVLTGDDFLNVISDVFVEGMAGHETGGNVYSFMGSLLGHGGTVLGFACAAVMVFAAYLFLGWAWRARSGPLRAAALYGVAVFAFGWFDYYFWLLTPYEIMAMSLALGLPPLLYRGRQ